MNSNKNDNIFIEIKIVISDETKFIINIEQGIWLIFINNFSGDQLVLWQWVENVSNVQLGVNFDIPQLIIRQRWKCEIKSEHSFNEHIPL